MNDHRYENDRDHTEEPSLRADDAPKPVMDKAAAARAYREERRDLRRWHISFRVNGNEYDHIAESVSNTDLNRSELIRLCLSGVGVVYVGSDIVESIYTYRADLARIGNLIKMLVGEIQQLYSHPSLSVAERNHIETIAAVLEDAYDDLARTKTDIVRVMERVNRTMEELRHGDF